MKALLLKYWERLRSSFWFVPAAMACLAVALAFGAVALDRAVTDEWLERLGWRYSGGAEGASLMLSTVAGSMIAIAGTVFSMTLVAMSLASSQLGPRLLRNFMRDTANQLVLGTFVATFVYCLLVLRTIRRADEVAFVPQLSVSIGVLLAVLSIGVLIYFIHHVSVSIQADVVVARVSDELHDGIGRMFPGHLGKSRSDTPNPADEAELPAAFVLGNQRTATEDIEFSFLQLVEIAVRALSPGINDPFTAIACIDRLGSALCRLAGRDMPSPFRFDDLGQLRLVATGYTFAGIADTAFNQIRQNARSNPAVAIRMLDAIAQIAGHVRSAQDAACLRRHADMIVRGAREAVPEAGDRLDVEARYLAATTALSRLHGAADDEAGS